MRQHAGDARAALRREVKVHVLGVLLELGQDVGGRRPHDFVDAGDLVGFVGARKERVQRHDFKHDAADAPNVHAFGVPAVGEQALRRAVPPRGNVLRVRLFAVNAAARPKIRQLQFVVHNQDVFRLDVPVENTVAVHVVHGLQQLEHVHLDLLLREVVPAPPDEFVDVAVHEFKHERQAAGGFVAARKEGAA